MSLISMSDYEYRIARVGLATLIFVLNDYF